jgi:hypothetical protein
LPPPCGAVLIDAGGYGTNADDHLIAYLQAFFCAAKRPREPQCRTLHHPQPSGSQHLASPYRRDLSSRPIHRDGAC